MRAQSKALVALALVALLAGCDTTDSSAPSGAEAPRLTVTVLTGTKAAPAASPIIRIEWEHESKIMVSGSEMQITKYQDYINNIGAGNTIGQIGFSGNPKGDTTISIVCHDSTKVFIKAWPILGKITDPSWVTPNIFAIDTSKIVYCK